MHHIFGSVISVNKTGMHLLSYILQTKYYIFHTFHHQYSHYIPHLYHESSFNLISVMNMSVLKHFPTDFEVFQLFSILIFTVSGLTYIDSVISRKRILEAVPPQ